MNRIDKIKRLMAAILDFEEDFKYVAVDFSGVVNVYKTMPRKGHIFWYADDDMKIVYEFPYSVREWDTLCFSRDELLNILSVKGAV